MQHWFREMERYRAMRRETVLNYVGAPAWAESLGVSTNKGMLGNLIQMAAQAHAITLAYSEPRFGVIANQPAGDAVADRMLEFLNRYSQMINMGDIARAVALDSYFGYGVVRVDSGVLPPNLQRLAGQQVGPMCWRVSQDNFVFDGSAACWEEAGFQGNLYMLPLDEARAFEGFDPEQAARLQEFGNYSDHTNSAMHQQSTRQSTPQAMVRLVDVFLPHAGVIATWSANNHSFSDVAEEPLMVRVANCHSSGPYAVLSHLDIPDNLAPIPQCESVKGLHFLFNDLADITSEQAKTAKINPVYEIGSQRDMERLENADDRQSVGVSNINKIGTWERPGPTQSQTAYMQASLSMFKEFSGNLDDTLGLGPTAGTATQSQLIRQRTTVRGAEARRRMDRMMELIARKLAHLAINDQTLRLPMRRKLDGTDLTLDVSWLPPHELPREAESDDFLITVEPYSMEYRPPEARLASLNEATGQTIQAAQAVAAGVPLDLTKFVETQARYRNLPEFREFFIGVLPEFQQQKEQAAAPPFKVNDPSKGHYVRENVSERNNAGALTQSLTQIPGNEAGGVQLAG